MAVLGADLAERIKSFADLLGVVLVFLTLFTGQRQEAIRALRASSKARKPDALIEIVIVAALGVITVVCCLAGADLFALAVRHFHPLAGQGAVRSLYVILWLLLLGLIVWQISLLRQATTLRGRLPERDAGPR
jgi:hypothetical protein